MDNLHIYPEVTMLHVHVLQCYMCYNKVNVILECYPHPIIATAYTHNKHLIASTVSTLEAPNPPTPTSEDVMKEFLTFFSRVIKKIKGEEFNVHASLVDNANPFCVNTHTCTYVCVYIHSIQTPGKTSNGAGRV